MIESVEVTGRTPQPSRKKLNPVWWFLNDGEQTVDEAPWYKSDYPWLIRYLFWNFLRNPMMNFRNYVIGVGDRNYKVLGKRPAMTIQRDDLCPPELGWQWSIIRLNCGIILPFFSYSGKRLVIQCGWQPFGYAEIKINWRKVAFFECDGSVGNEPFAKPQTFQSLAVLKMTPIRQRRFNGSPHRPWAAARRELLC